MCTITVEKECGCFKKSPFEKIMSFETRDEAQKHLKSMKTRMNTMFCGKHHFEVKEDGENFFIEVSLKELDQEVF